MYDPEMRKDCPMRGNLGNCSPVGGFCMDAVSDEICAAVHNAYDRGFYNAVRKLKEQEAKVLTIDQLEEALDTVVWLETPVSENLADGYSLIMAYSHKYGYMFFDSPFGDNPSQDRLEYSEYGKSWRCWDKRPTDEQRQAVKWE